MKPKRVVEGMKRRASRLYQQEQALLKARKAMALGEEISRPDIFGHCNDAAWLYVNTAGYRSRKILRQILPSLPPDDLQKRFIGRAGDPALGEAFRAYSLWLEMAARNGRPIGKSSRVLDFGCGWGRTLRFFMREVPVDGLYGVDVLADGIEACRKTNRWCHFDVVNPFPPTKLPSESFDLIYLYSVFSHLSEEAHDKWLDEFRRLLRPGGLVIATTWHREYIKWCERARRGDTRGTHVKSVEAFVGTDEWLARYDRGEFCHSAVGAGGDLTSQFYGETCIPEAYVRRHWADRFEICEFYPADFRRIAQNAIVARRR